MPKISTAQRRENKWQQTRFKASTITPKQQPLFNALFVPAPTGYKPPSLAATSGATATKFVPKTKSAKHKKNRAKVPIPHLAAQHAQAQSEIIHWLCGLIKYLLKYGLKPSNLIKFLFIATAVFAALPLARSESDGFDLANPNSSPFPEPTTYPIVPHRGPNIAGCDFDTFDPPDVLDPLFHVKKGANTIRLPFKLESIQSNFSVPINFNEGNAQTLNNLASIWSAANITVIIDMHNYMRYNNSIIGAPGSTMSAQDYANTWACFARQYKGNPYIWFDLMNEPYGVATELVVNNYRIAIQAIRDAGFRGPILLEGNAWTGINSWLLNWYGTPNGNLFTRSNIPDPYNNTLIEVHAYFNDPNGGGSGYGECVNANQVLTIENFQAFINWLHSTGQNAFLGELNGINTPNCIAVLNTFLSAVIANPATPQGGGFVGFTGWAGGHSWGDGYALYLGPYSNGTESPQMHEAFDNFLTPPGGPRVRIY